MSNFLKLVVIALSFFMFSGAVEAKKTLTAHRADHPATIDGRLDEPCWENAERADRFTIFTSDTELAAEQTVARVLYDDDHLYVGIECLESRMDLVRKAIEANPEAFVYQQGQSVEIFFGPKNNRRTFLQIMVNTNGTVEVCATEPMHLKNIEVESAVRLEEDRFIVELKIPYSVLHLLPNAEGVWDFQVGRARMIEGTHTQLGPDRVFSAWTYPYVSFRYPRFFGYLRIPVDPAEYYYHIEPEAHSDSYHLVVTNHTGRDSQIVMEVFVDESEEPELYPLDLKAGKSERIEFPFDPEEGIELKVFLKDSKTEKLLYQGGTALQEVRDELIDDLEKDFQPADIGEEPYVVFVKDYMERSNNRTRPQVHEIGQPLKVFASLGEYKPVSFAVRANQDLKQVQIKLADDLKGPDGETISKDRVEIRVVELMNRWLDPFRYVKTEAFLIRNRPRDIFADTTQRYWLTLHVPEDAAPGRYRTNVEVTPANEESKTLALEVEILPIRLERPEGMNYYMYLSTGFPGNLPVKLHTREYLRKIYTDMQEHGMTTVNLFGYPAANGPDGPIDIYADREGHMPIGVQLEVLQEVGLVAEWSAVPWMGAGDYGLRADEWKVLYDMIEERNWPEVLIYIVDEPAVGRYEQVEEGMGRVAEFREKYPQYSHVRTTTSGAENPAVSHYYDVWIASESISREDIERGKEMGKEVWSYDCGLGPVDAQSSRFYFGLWCWKSGAKGASHWAYFDEYTMYDRFDNSGVIRDSERDLVDYKHMFNFVYPASDELVPTIGWEAVREGVDDYRYLWTLKKTIDQAREAGVDASLIAQAETTIDEVENSIDIRNLGEKRGAATSRVGVGRREFERYPPEEGLTNGGYDRLRYKVAREIVKLNAAMKITENKR